MAITTTIDPKARVLEIFRNAPQPLFALFDAARDDQILDILCHAGADGQSLFQGKAGVSLATVAPYLVQVPKHGDLLRELVEKGWGQSWGVWLTSTTGFHILRAHLRSFLQVKDETGKQVYFRFYDPRVLREYLPACTPEEARQFLGPIRRLFVEASEPDQMISFALEGEGVQRIVASLVPRPADQK